MARVMANHNNHNTNDHEFLPNTTPFLDRTSHEVIKETSKSLKHYFEVKRRENAFVLNSNSFGSEESIPLKPRYLYGTTREFPPNCGSMYSNPCLKFYMRSLRKKNLSLSNVEKRMCREELNFHMQSEKTISTENQKFAELRLRRTARSSSSCSKMGISEFPKKTIKSTPKVTLNEHHQLMDHTADILASIVKSRRSIYEKFLLEQQATATYDSRNANPTPRQPEDQPNIHSPARSIDEDRHEHKKLSVPVEKTKKTKRKTENTLARATAIMRNAKPITMNIVCDYKVSVTTGNCNGASTNAHISIKFYGTNGHTDFLELSDSETHRVPFLKGQTDVFIVSAYHVGELVGITIGHDQKDIRSSWFLSKVSIEDPIRDMTYNIPCNAWLSIKSSDQKTKRDFQVVSAVSDKEKSERLCELESSSEHSFTGTDDEVKLDLMDQNHRHGRANHYKHTSRRKLKYEATHEKATVKKQTSTSYMLTKANSHDSLREIQEPPVTAYRGHSPILNRTPTPTSDVENQNIDSITRSRTVRSPSILRTDPMANDIRSQYSTDNQRVSARLGKRTSPVLDTTKSPTRRSIDNTDENDHFNFFD